MDSGLEIMERIAAGEQGDGLTRTADLIGTGSDFRLQGDRKQSIHEEYIYSCTESWRYVSLDVKTDWVHDRALNLQYVRDVLPCK